MSSLIMLVDEFGQPIAGENETVLVRDTITDTDFYVSKYAITLASEEPVEAVASPSEDPTGAVPSSQLEPIESVALSELEPVEDNQFTQESQQDSGFSRAHWTRHQILQLIDSYTKHKKLFDNATLRNVTVWNCIATHIDNHTGPEAMNKFKYLKARYTKKKDNMSANSSGAKAVHFEYFNKFDEIFGKDPNIIPPAIACSSRMSSIDANETITSMQSPEDPISSHRTVNEGSRKRKKDTLLEFLKQKEEARERRHQDSMKALNQFNYLMERFLDQ